jgi:hypothetical protein
MAQLPKASDFGFSTPQASRGVQQISPAPVSNAIGHALGEVGELFHREAAQLDAAKAEDALNKIRQARLDMTAGESGFAKVQGGDTLTPGFVKDHTTRFADVGASLMANLTPSQRALLKPHIDQQNIGFSSDIYKHAIAEGEKYRAHVAKSSIDISTSIGVQFWGDSQQFDIAKQGIMSTVRSTLANKGLTDDVSLVAEQKNALSPMYTGAIESALNSRNLDRADQLLQEGAQWMDPEVKIKAHEAISKAFDDRVVKRDLSKDLTKLAVYNSLQEKTMRAVVLSAESGGKHYGKDGEILKSSADAFGKFQIRVDSAKDDAKFLGEKFDKDLFFSKTPEGEAYHEKLYSAHISRLYSLPFIKSTADVLAAYNAGEGAVQAAQKRFAQEQADGTPSTAKSYFDLLPKETRDYVAKTTKQLDGESDVKMTDIAISGRAKTLYPDNPIQQKSYMVEAGRILKEREDAKAKEIESVKEQMYSMAAKDGLSFQEMPFGLVSKLPVKEQMSVRSTIDSLHSGTPKNSDMGKLLELNADPGTLALISPSDWNGPWKARHLSSADWEVKDKQRSALLGGRIPEASRLSSGIISDEIGNHFRLNGIEYPAQKSNSADVIRQESTRKVIETAILTEQGRLGRQLDDGESRAIINGLFKHTIPFKDYWFSSTKNIPVLALPTGELDELPDNLYSSIKSDLKAKGITVNDYHISEIAKSILAKVR